MVCFRNLAASIVLMVNAFLYSMAASAKYAAGLIEEPVNLKQKISLRELQARTDILGDLLLQSLSHWQHKHWTAYDPGKGRVKFL